MKHILFTCSALLLAPLANLHSVENPKVSAVLNQAASALPAGFGAEVNPTGQPIGGGAGYTAGPRRSDATRQVRTLAELKQSLAAAKAGEVVWIESGNTIDFTGTRIEVPEKVTLAGDRGQNGSDGALLTARHSGDMNFIMLSPGARLTGVRVRGSNPLMKDLDSQKSDPAGYAISCANAEVDNCEISQFQRGGVALYRDSDRSHIHHNFIHDVASYPVFLGNGTGDAHTIEANRIEWAWHAVASNASRGSGYTARYNEFIRVPRPKLFDQRAPTRPTGVSTPMRTRARKPSRRIPPHASSSRTTTPSSPIPT
ncbi:MAG: right-handed parallel beta-helix repeat-containing protein [Limisphaerales bacterium]